MESKKYQLLTASLGVRGPGPGPGQPGPASPARPRKPFNCDESPICHDEGLAAAPAPGPPRRRIKLAAHSGTVAGGPPGRRRHVT
eukprot:88285-Hanusia_phi.AAC.1